MLRLTTSPLPRLLPRSSPSQWRTLAALCGLVMALAPNPSLAQKPVVVDVVPARSTPSQPLTPPSRPLPVGLTPVDRVPAGLIQIGLAPVAP